MSLPSSTPVLVVGGSVTGLAAALFLAWRGVPTVVVERHPGSSPHPRALGFTTRTLELFRAVGLGPDVPQVPLGAGRPRRVKVESLAGRWETEVAWNPAAVPTPTPRSYSPCTGAAIAQDRLEPILRAKATALGADIRSSTELVSFEQDDTGVTARLRPRGGEEQTLRARYLVAADGHQSTVREALGIARHGHGRVRVVRSVLFRSELEEYLAAGISQFELDQPELEGMLTTYRDGRWLLMFSDDEERGVDVLRGLVARAIGRSDVPFEIITTGRWDVTALIADRFREGRVFLAGDAAHTLPPARGGYGANTGIEDASNLAWKLAAVLSGHSAPALLDTYDAERRPIAWLRHDQIFARPDYAAAATDAEKRVPILDDDAMELGQIYRSGAIIGADESLPPALRPDQWAGQPGTRAPHLWGRRGGERVSTLDLLQRGWVLLTEDDRWRTATEALGVVCVRVGDGGDLQPPRLGASALTIDTPIEQIVAEPEGAAVLDTHLPTLRAHDRFVSFQSMSLRELQPVSRGIITHEGLAQIGTALAHVQCHALAMDDGSFRLEFRTAFGISASGATLVRPDGYIAWRSLDRTADPATALRSALRKAACASSGDKTGSR